MKTLLHLAFTVIVAVQTPRSVPAADPRQLEIDRIIGAYEHGDADAAVEDFCRLASDASVMQLHLGTRMTETEMALFRTEVGLRLNTFGRYALSAPLVPASHTVGLNGMFEFNSLVAYRDIQGGSRQLVRDWYVVTVSYCLHAHLDCADPLLAAARRDFDDDPDILLLAGSVAASRGEFREAETSLRRALAASPGLVEARLRLARVSVVRGRTAEAQRELGRVVTEARAGHDNFALYFGLLSLADLDERAGRTTSARARRREADDIAPFADPWAVFHAAQFWQVPTRIAAMRRAVLER